MTLADLLPTDPAPDEVVVYAGDDEVTSTDLGARAGELAHALRAAGAGDGTAVAVMLPNDANVVVALFGVWQADAVYVPLNPRLSDREVDHVLTSVAPAAVVTTVDHAGRFADRVVVVLGDGPAHVRPVVAGAGEGPAHDVRRYDADVALVSFTSGTTGAPKPVLLTHSGVQELIDGVLAKLRSRPAPGPAGGAGAAPTPPRAPMPNLVPVSLSVWAGIYNVLFAFSTGAPVVLMDRFDTTTFAELVRRHGIRSSVLPPAAIAMLADDESIVDLAPLRFVRSISAPLSPLQARRFRDRFGIAVLNGWGQTEIGGEIVGWNAADSRQFGDTKLGSVGRPHRGVDIRVIDPDAVGADAGTDVSAGEPGELWVRTPALSAGYADGNDLGDRLTADGWFRTGDVGRVDEDGFVWIEGRASDMINRGGLKVHPGEVEEVLRLHPEVADVAVAAIPDDRLGEVPAAFLVLAEGAPAPPDAELESLCRQHLAPYKVPVRFAVVDALPRNDVGKVVKRELVAGPLDG